jgi:hypothetical protein
MQLILKLFLKYDALFVQLVAQKLKVSDHGEVPTVSAILPEMATDIRERMVFKLLYWENC